MADPKYDQGVRRDKDLLPYAVEMLPEDEFGDLQFDGELIFGSGDDGDVTITSDTSLTEDMYYGNLTVNTGATLNPNGFRVFVKNTLTLTGDIGVKEAVASVTTGSLAGTVGVGTSITDGLGGAGEPDGYVPGYTFSGSGAVNSSVGVSSNDFFDLRDAINSYKQRGSNFFRVKGGAGGGTGADGVDGTGTAGQHPSDSGTVGVPGGRGTAGTGGSGGTGGRGGGVVMVSARVISGAGGIYSEGGGGVTGSAGTGGTPAPDSPFPSHHSVTPGNSYTHNFTNADVHGTGHGSGVSPGNPWSNDPTYFHTAGTSPAGTNPVNHHTNHHEALSPGPSGVNNPGHNPGQHIPIPGTQNPPVHNDPSPSGHHSGNHNPTNHTYQPGNVNPGNPYANFNTNMEIAHASTGGNAAFTTNHAVGTTPGNSGVHGSSTNHHGTSHTTPGNPGSHTGANPSVPNHTPAGVYTGGAGGTGYTGQRGGRGGGGVLIVVTRKAGTPSYSLNTGVNGRLIALDTANI